MLDIKIKELKQIIYEKTFNVLKTDGFKGNKTEVHFIKKEKERKISIGFDFSEYYPIDYQFKSLATITFPLLSSVVNEFYKNLNLSNKSVYNIILYEGQFIDKLESYSPKDKRAYYHSVASKKFANVFISQSLDTLVNKILPFINELENLEHFQKFIMDNPSYLKENFENTEFFVSALLAIKLKDKQKFEKITSIMEKLLIEEKQNGRDYKKHLFYLEKLKSYSINVTL
jgi:hypothetical protein